MNWTRLFFAGAAVLAWASAGLAQDQDRRGDTRPADSVEAVDQQGRQEARQGAQQGAERIQEEATGPRSDAAQEEALSTARVAQIEVAVRRVLQTQQAAWNRGDIRLYMQGYARSPDLRFLSGSELQRGWEETLLRYLDRYGDRGAMGRLIFSDLVIKVLSDQYALAYGRWMLVRETDRPEGLFTLIFQEREDGWRIIHDHTSAGPE